jgi:NADH:ubiquinone oxidoreductase subunit 6 (subunit J)|tara:strand:- start:6001 stop:6273 length:273 start_codon:yes stop_codon:yes gene_type:complete
MKAVSLFARLGVFAFVLVLLREVMEHPMFSDSSTQVPPTTVDFAVSILNDWAIITIVLGLLLAMAMIGASYLVRDERLVNLLYDMGGEER